MDPSTIPDSAEPSSSFKVWHFFVLAALAAASAAVLMSGGPSLSQVILISLIIGAASLTGVAVFRTLRPLVTTEEVDKTEMIGGWTRAALEREKTLALRSIKELDFDHAMGKVSDPDWHEMGARLRARAIRLMKQLDGDDGYRTLIERELEMRLRPGARSAAEGAHAEVALPPGVEARPAPPSSPAPCVACGTVSDADARFCKKCGAKLVATV